MERFVSKFQKARAANSTDSSFPSKVPTLTQPTGAGVLTQPAVGSYNREFLQVCPYGEGADNALFDLRVIGWKPTTNDLWIPLMLVQAACTLSAAVGVAASDVLNTERFADTIVLTLSNGNVDTEVLSPTGDRIGSFIVDTKGCPLVEITFDLNTATGANALVSWI